MKTFLSLICLLFFFINASATSNSELFSYDKEKINQELTKLEELESYVESNKGCTYSTLELTNSSLIKNVTKNDVCFFARDNNNPPLGIPSFIWGCCFNVPGMMVVYMMMDGSDARPEQMDKAFKGCVVSAVGLVILYVVYGIIIASTIGSTISY